MKKLIAITAIAGLAVLALAVAVPASAATVGVTDDESRVGITSSWFASLFQRVFHTTDIDNAVVDSSSNSGRNTIVSDDDQSNTSIGTGGTTSATLVDNTAGNTATLADVESSDGTTDTVSDTTDESRVNIDYDDEVDDDFRVENEADVENNITSDADAGRNTVDSGDDLDFAAVTTGTADSATGLSNMFGTVLRDFFRTIRM